MRTGDDGRVLGAAGLSPPASCPITHASLAPWLFRRLLPAMRPPLAPRPGQQSVPILGTPSAEDAALLLLLVPVIVEVKVGFGCLPALALPPSATALLRVAEADAGALLNGARDGAEARVDVIMREGPDTGGGIFSDGLGIVCDLIPSLAQAGVLEEGHGEGGGGGRGLSGGSSGGGLGNPAVACAPQKVDRRMTSRGYQWTDLCHLL